MIKSPQKCLICQERENILTFIVIITSGLLFGVIGMVVAIPTYTAVKVILKEFLYDYKFVQKLTKDL